MDSRTETGSVCNFYLNKILLTFLLVMLWLALTAMSHAAELVPRFVPPKQIITELNAAQADDKLIVKFAEGSGVRLRNNRLLSTQGKPLQGARDILRTHNIGVRQIRRLHAVSERALEKLKQRGEQRAGRQLADLNLYYEVTIPRGENIIEVMNEFNALEIVEFSEPAPKPLPLPVDIPPTTPDFRPNQLYKDAAPNGINTVDEASFPGAGGTNMQVVDVEYSWLFDHEDLELPPSTNIDTQPAVDPFNSTEHGTAVLGEIGGKDNVYGVTGIAPDTTMFVAPANTTLGYNPARAITLATAALNPGDVILIEQQYWACGTGNYGPLEVLQSVFDAISVATANDIIVVEAAGNGSVDLDAPGCGSLFDRTFRDSGAIIVGAGVPGTRVKYGYSTYGSRVDVQGWGGQVTTTGYGGAFNPGDKRQYYTHTFSGTSSASPIVSGAVLSIQGALKGAGIPVLTPLQARDLLVATGSPQPAADEALWHIGPLPNILGAINSLMPADLLVENFNDRDYLGWTVVDQGTINAPSDWSAASGAMYQHSGIYSPPTDASPEKLGSYVQYDGGFSWTDYRATFTMSSGNDDALGFMFRVNDSDNYYRFSWDRERSYRRLVKRVAGVTSILQEDTVPYAGSRTYEVEITALGSQLQVRIDGVLIFDVIDTDLSAGSIALYTWSNRGSKFDDITVKNLVAGNNPPMIYSVIATPSLILDTESSQLEVNATDHDGGPNPIGYNWIVPAGQGSVDDPASVTPIYTPADVSVEQMVVITAEVTDGSVTVSDSVTVNVQDASAPPPLLVDDFNDRDYLGWSIVDEGTINAPSSWSALNGVMHQASSIYSPPTDASPEKLGTYAQYDGGFSWTNYRATFTMASGSDDAFGFMFRVSDSNNYYRFSWDRERSYRRLVKRVAGVTSILQEDTELYVSGRTYEIEITAQGSQLQVRIDGILIFDVTDTDLSAGSVALYTWGNASSRFDDVLVEGL